MMKRFYETPKIMMCVLRPFSLLQDVSLDRDDDAPIIGDMTDPVE